MMIENMMFCLYTLRLESVTKTGILNNVIYCSGF